MRVFVAVGTGVRGRRLLPRPMARGRRVTVMATGAAEEASA
ncbi:hypothetical protein [Embleya sp. NPDC005575]